jgi:aryl-alcohol dehydrogenase-like predicted oxidoreductase
MSIEHTTLTGTGATVSRLSLGTMTFGAQADEATSLRMVNTAIDGGINFFDTADAYGKGRSEEILGKALQGKRNRVVLASKVCSPMGPDARDGGLHRWHIIQGVEASLRRLQTDCLDIFYLHKPDRNTPMEETLAAMDTLVQQGKVIYVGMSNYSAWQVCRAQWLSQDHHWSPPVVLQLPYNLITRVVDEECAEFTATMQVGVTAYNPLAGGLLTGKHSKGDPAKGTRFALNENYYGRFWHDSNFAALEELSRIAEGVGLDLTELALQFLLSRNVVDSVIVGASKVEHLELNLKAAEGRLDQTTLDACDGVWQQLRGDHFAYNR